MTELIESLKYLDEISTGLKEPPQLFQHSQEHPHGLQRIPHQPFSWLKDRFKAPSNPLAVGSTRRKHRKTALMNRR